MNCRNLLVFFALVFISLSLPGQTGFALEKDKRRAHIRFQLVNNLPVVEVEINDVPLSFILDTGVKSSVLFSLEAVDSVRLNKAKPVRLRGLGDDGYIEALRSLGNTLKVGKTIDTNHTLFIIFDSGLNFSPRMGIPIHGILGNDFFKNFIVKINYAREKITVYDPRRYSYRRCRKCEDLALIFHKDKPYIKLKTGLEGNTDELMLLVDSGSSYVLWLFDEKDYIEEYPANYFNDFLGLGLGGDIYGKRTRIPNLIVGNSQLKEVNTSFPEEKAIPRDRLFKDRDGSVGGGFLRRFTVVFDYGAKRMRLKKNKNFEAPFHYNMSGLTIEHEGVEMVRSEKQAILNIDPTHLDGTNKTKIPVTTEFEFILVPKYVVVNVREGSPAALAGILKGDRVLSIGRKPSHQYKLYELIELFSRKEGRKITMEIGRNGSPSQNHLSIVKNRT